MVWSGWKVCPLVWKLLHNDEELWLECCGSAGDEDRRRRWRMQLWNMYYRKPSAVN
jgi:hypothetical protein